MATNNNIITNISIENVTYTATARKAINRKGIFQLEGTVANESGKKLTNWFWALDAKTGHLYHDPKSEKGRAYVVTEFAPGCGFVIAEAVEAAFKARSAKTSETAPVAIEDVADEVAMIDGMEENPVDRLAAGDPSLFMELGISQTYATKWAKEIRESGVAIASIEDMVLVNGVGPRAAEKLVTAWNEKFSA